MWTYDRSLLLAPAHLVEGLEARQVEHEEASVPWRDRRLVVDDLLREHQGALDRLLDLYLDGTIFPAFSAASIGRPAASNRT